MGQNGRARHGHLRVATFVVFPTLLGTLTIQIAQSPAKWHLVKHSQALFDCSYCPPRTCICGLVSFPALLIILLRTTSLKVIISSDLAFY